MYDAIVAGAGPGGATAAACMADAGLRVLVVDKSAFPRDKICGDALSGKTVDVLKRLDLIDDVHAVDQVASWGISFGGPKGDVAHIPFTMATDRPVAPGFVCARAIFDDLVVQRARRAGAEIRERTEVAGLLRDGQKVTGVQIRSNGRLEDIHAPIVIGADGAYSIVARELGMAQLDPGHYCAGLRLYMDGVTGFTEDNYLELHFVEEAIPGYFWLFPMANGRANIGIGMLSSVVKDRDVRLKELLNNLLEHPQFRDRFKNAERVGPTKGWGLPLGSRPRRMAGDGWMLIGDAASLIDPFSGEGIGNAMVSGEIAARWSVAAVAAQNFSAPFLAGHEKEVLRTLRGELRLSHQMQRLGRWKWLLNTVIAKASRSREVAETISCMFESHEDRQQLVSPSFYLKLLTA
jgi:menaquinone-9 beta-reductase